MVKRVKFVSIPVSDQQRALEFWTKKAGFEVFTDQPMGADRWLELKIPGAETRVVLFGTTPDKIGLAPPSFAAAFATDSVEKTLRELRDRGVEFTTEPKKEPWGTYAIFRDTEGSHLLLGTMSFMGSSSRLAEDRRTTAGQARKGRVVRYRRWAARPLVPRAVHRVGVP